MNITPITEKECSICGKVKPITEFYSQKKHTKTKGDYIYYHPECKECTIKRSTNWLYSNPDKMHAQERKQKQTDKYKLRHKKDVRKSREKGVYKEWQINNPNKISKYNKNHRNHDINKREWEACKQYFNYECGYCGITEQESKNIYGQNLHKEHVQHNGANDLSNCVPSCKICNSSKRQNTLEDWYNENNPNFSQDRLNKIYQWLKEDYNKYIE